MKTWNCLNTKSIYELIPDHTPSGKYTHIVDQLLLEELHTQKIGRSYQADSTFWTISGFEINNSCTRHKEQYADVLKKIKTIQETLSAEGLKQEKKKELQAQLDNWYMNKFHLEKTIKDQEKFLAKLEYLDAEMNKFYRSMRVVLRKYSETHDTEYLKKGIDLLFCTREERMKATEDEVRRTFLLDEIGSVSEFRRLFDLEEIPLYQLYRLQEIYRRYIKRETNPKFLTEAALYYVNQLTEVGKYSPPKSTCHDEPSGKTAGITWRNEEGEIENENETRTKENERRDNEIETRSQRETDFYEAKASRWI